MQRFLTLLQSDGMLEITCDTKKTVLTVANWDKFQVDSKKVGHGWDTDGTPMGTIKKGKNVKNGKKEDAPSGEGESAAQTRDAAPARHARGQYGWVKLTDDEYQRIAAEFGQADVDRYIAVVEERAQASGNKYKWKDWSLVVRKAIREHWGDDRRGSSFDGAKDKSQTGQPGAFEQQAVKQMRRMREGQT